MSREEGGYSRVYRNGAGRLRLPFGHLSLLLGFHKVPVKADTLPAIENLVQIVPSIMILARRLRGHLSRYEETTWVAVPYRELFLDTQAVVLFLRQFLEDVALLTRLLLPKCNLPASFTDLAKRLTEAARQDGLDDVLPATDSFRRFVIAEKPWLDELKDLRDDISHRTTYGRVRPRFANITDILLSGGGKAPFASSRDLRSYLCDLFERWLAMACVVSEFAEARVRAAHPGSSLPAADAYILAANDFEAAVSDVLPQRPVGTVVMTVPADDYAALEFFLDRKAA